LLGQGQTNRARKHQTQSPVTLGTNVLEYLVNNQHKILPELGSAYGIEKKKERCAPNLHELMAGWLLRHESQYLLKHLTAE